MNGPFELLPAPVDDPRWEGWPCMGQHKDGVLRSNQHARWETCPRCGIRLKYWTRGAAKGNRRTAGPSREVVATAIGQIRMEYTASQVTEKMIVDKCMEITGRMRQDGRAVVLSEPMSKHHKDPPIENEMTTTTTRASVEGTWTAPTCTARKTEGLLNQEALSRAAPKRANLRAKDAPAASTAKSEKAPVDLEDQEVHENLQEILALEKRLELQKAALLEEMNLRGLMEHDEDGLSQIEEFDDQGVKIIAEGQNSERADRRRSGPV